MECKLADDHVELTSWLDASQIGREKNVKLIEDSFRDAIEPEPRNNTEHIFLVWLAPKRRMNPSDKVEFRAELLVLMEAIDKDWTNIPQSDSPQGFDWADFTRYPTLGKYLSSIEIPRREIRLSTMKKGNRHWLTFPARVAHIRPTRWWTHSSNASGGKLRNIPPHPGCTEVLSTSAL